LNDPRRQDRIRYQGVELLRERIYAMAMGDAHQDDLDRLAHDPAIKLAAWDRPGEEVLNQRMASQPTQSRLIDWLAACKTNREAVRNALFDWTHRHVKSTDRTDRRVRYATIDIDSFPIQVYGHQPGASYNGYYKEIVYHPMVASFSVGGDYDSTREGLRLGNGYIHAVLREGNVHTAKGIKRFVRNVIKRARQLAWSFDLRLDAGYIAGPVLDELTDENIRFCGRVRKNNVLETLAEPHLKRPVGRPPAGGYEDVIELGMYQAEGWRHAQRLLLVIVDKPDAKTGQLELFPRYFFLITNWTEQQRSGEEVLSHYRKRGTFEDRLGEFNEAIGCRLSSSDFAENEVALLLGLLAFNLSSMMRCEFEGELGGCWDLRRFQQSVLRTAARVTKGSRRLLIYIEQSVRPFWEAMASRIRSLRLADLWSRPRGVRPRAYTPPPRHAHQRLVLRD
jgi:Transposase DDE domain group 1